MAAMSWTSGHLAHAAPILLALIVLPRCGDEPLQADGGAAGEGIVPADHSALDPILEANGQPFFQPYSFVVLGDTQPPVDCCLIPGFPAMRALPRVISDLAPTFVVHVGDLMDRGSAQGAYETFRYCYGAILTRPFFPTMGNHDQDWGLGLRNYKTFLEEQLLRVNPLLAGSDPQPYSVVYNNDHTPYSTDMTHPSHTDILPSGFTQKTFYAFRYRNSAFLSFEQGMPSSTCTPTTWVERRLRAARSDPAIQHIFVFMHYPLYISTVREAYLKVVFRPSSTSWRTFCADRCSGT